MAQDEDEIAAESRAYAQRFQEHFREIDESAMVLLKGHLLVDELLTEIIGRGVHHADLMPRLDFSKKTEVARSMSLSEQNSEVWKAVVALNELRNVLAHSLNSPRRPAKTDALLAACRRAAAPNDIFHDASSDPVRLIYACSFIYGFLSGFNEEMKRFRDLINGLDSIMNEKPPTR